MAARGAGGAQGQAWPDRADADPRSRGSELRRALGNRDALPGPPVAGPRPCDADEDRGRRAQAQRGLLRLGLEALAQARITRIAIQRPRVVVVRGPGIAMSRG